MRDWTNIGIGVDFHPFRWRRPHTTWIGYGSGVTRSFLIGPLEFSLDLPG